MQVADPKFQRGLSWTVCVDHDEREGVYGIVSNGHGWVFYRLTQSGEVFETGVYTTQYLTQLLGALDHVCAECARNVP